MAGRHAGASPTADEAVLDTRLLDSLAAQVPADVFRSLLDNWLNNTATGVDRVAALAAAGDAAGLARQLHRLAGTAGTFGAHRLGGEARRMEEACAAHGLETVRAMVPAFQDVARRTLDAVRARFGAG